MAFGVGSPSKHRKICLPTQVFPTNKPGMYLAQAQPDFRLTENFLSLNSGSQEIAIVKIGGKLLRIT